MKIDGKLLAEEILKNLKQKIEIEIASNQSILGSHPKTPPTMAVILVGINPASLSYIKQKQKSAEKIGAKVILKQFPENISLSDLKSYILNLNSNPQIHGIILQRPLPISFHHPKRPVYHNLSEDGKEESRFFHSEQSEESQNNQQLAISNRQLTNFLDFLITPEKDIDSFHPKSKFLPPVGLAVLQALYFCHSERSEESHPYLFIDLIKNLNISNPLKIPVLNPLNGKNLKLKIFLDWLSAQEIILLGRGETGGKPIAKTMDKFKIKYIQTHSKTKNTSDILKSADIIISAAGKPNLITGSMIKKGAICIGVGISRTPVISKSKAKEQSTNTTHPNLAVQQTSSKNLSMEQGNIETMKANPAIQQSTNTINKLIGDFEEASISSKASFYTPTPGGIGPLTVAFLFNNLINAFKKYA